MERAEIQHQLVELLRSTELASDAELGQLRDDTSLVNEIGLTSLQLLDLIASIEQAFGFRASSDTLRIDTFDRFDRVVDFVAAALSSQARAVGMTSEIK